MRFARSVSAALAVAFMSTAFVVLPDQSESISWSAPIAIGDGLSGHVASISSAANRLGQIVVAWTAWDENYSEDVLANRYVPGEGWKGAEVIADNPEVRDSPAAGIDDSGNCLVVWTQGASIQSKTYTVGFGWGPIIEISSSNASRWFFNMDMVMASDGSAMAIWCDEEITGYRTAYKPAGGAWQVLAASLPYPAEITCDGLGHFLSTFTMYDGVRTGVYASIFTPGSGWGTEVHIENETYSAHIGKVAMNSRGDAVAVWCQYGYPDRNRLTAFANVYSLERGWGAASRIEELDCLWCGTPIVSIDEAGNAVAIWQRQANDLSSSLRTNVYTAGVGWGTPASMEYSSYPEEERVSTGIVGSETFATWIHRVVVGNGTEDYELVANHYNTDSGWNTPVVITTGIASSPSLVADNLGGAAIVWFGNETIGGVTTLDLFVSHYLAPPPPPGTHMVVRGAHGPRASAVTWEYAPSDYGTWTGMIVNNGLRSLLVDVYDVATGVPEEIAHQKIRFAANDAYPYGVVNTSGIVMSPIHRYSITVTPNGPRGSSCVVTDTFLRPQSPPVASFTVSPSSGNTATIFTFDASGSSDAETPLSDLQVRWDWQNDGVWDTAWSTMKQIENRFASPGTYTVCLEVKDTDGLVGDASKDVVVSNTPPPSTSIVYTAYDFFQEPWGEWFWNPNWRHMWYYQDYILSNTTGQYTMLRDPSQSGDVGIIYAPYRFNMTATSVSNVDVHHPEFMPILGGVGPQAGAETDMHLRMQYLDHAWWNSYWVPQFGKINPYFPAYLDRSNDGYLVGTVVTMDLNREAAYEWIGMPTVADPVTWWGTHQSSYEDAWSAWIDNEGNNRLDIYCGYEDRYYVLWTFSNMSIGADGDILLTISHISWGYEVLMTRWLNEAQLCTHDPWFEDFDLQASYGSGIADVSFDAVAQYGFHAVKANASATNEGAWAWDPTGIDYWPSWAQAPATHHSEYDPYAGPSWGGTTTYQSWNSGDPKFGQNVEYDATPHSFDLNEFQTLIVKLPTGSYVPGYLGLGVGSSAIRNMSIGDTHDYDALRYMGTASLGYAITNPANPLDIQSLYDPITKTLTITGPYDFDNPGGRGGGMLYHGAPWIEFNVTSMLRTESVVEATPESGDERASAATAEMLSVAVVISGVVIAIPALIGTRRWDD